MRLLNRSGPHVPPGYAINPVYLTTTPGIVVATRVYGNWPWPPYTPSDVVEIKITTTSGVFELFVGGSSVGITGTYTPPIETTSGKWESMFPAVGAGSWGEVSFVAGFFINPCTVGTYSWSPNIAWTPGNGVPGFVLMDPRTGYSNTVTIVECAVAAEVVAVSKMMVLAALAPWFGLAVLASIVTGVA
jgi:hypothetical protein